MTAIETYLSERGRKALEIVGPVEWDDCCLYHLVSPCEWKIVGATTRTITDHEAACLISNHIREWLEKRDTNVVYIGGSYEVRRMTVTASGRVECDYLLDGDDGLEWGDEQEAIHGFATHAEAQVEAVHAMAARN
jgi:hypothetical protein